MPIAPEEGMSSSQLRAANLAVNQKRTIANLGSANQKIVEQIQQQIQKQTASVAELEKLATGLSSTSSKSQTNESSKPYSPGDFRRAEEKSNEPYYAQQQKLITSTIPVPSGGDGPAPTPTPTPATPATVSPAVVAAVVAPAVKTAPIDTVLFNDDEVPIEVMQDLIFEDIGGHELINIARNDIINGQDISYQPIKNLTSVQQQYNPNNILSVQSTSDKYFSNFAIKLENKVPNVGNGPFGSNVYLDTTNGSLIIEAINLEADEQIEVEITLSGTIYEADLTGSES
jgi:hypothetical protein